MITSVTSAKRFSPSARITTRITSATSAARSCPTTPAVRQPARRRQFAKTATQPTARLTRTITPTLCAFLQNPPPRMPRAISNTGTARVAVSILPMLRRQKKSPRTTPERINCRTIRNLLIPAITATLCCGWHCCSSAAVPLLAQQLSAKRKSTISNKIV